MNYVCDLCGDEYSEFSSLGSAVFFYNENGTAIDVNICERCCIMNEADGTLKEVMSALIQMKQAETVDILNCSKKIF